MFALIAVILFALGALLALIGETGGEWNWLILFGGLFFLGLHLFWPWQPWTVRRP